MGRPSKYQTEVKDKLILVQGWARDGLTMEQIAHNLGISKETLYQYKRKYTEFSDAIKKGKEVVDTEVENALLKKALGYETTETKIEKSEQGKKEVTITKQIPGDTAAQIFWLKNRKPNKWRDKQNIDFNGNVNQNVRLTKEQRLERIKKLKEKMNKEKE